MFGVKSFDVVIGNPPYGAKLNKEKINEYKQIYKLKTSETAILFIERGYNLVAEKGIESFIIPKSFSFASNYQAARSFVRSNLAILGDCGKAFDEVKLEACIILINKNETSPSYTSVKFTDKKKFSIVSFVEKGIANIFGFFPNDILGNEIDLGLKILNGKNMLNEIAVNCRGDMVQSNLLESGVIKVIGGKEINRYQIKDIKGYLSIKNTLTEKSIINNNSILVQNIVAHLTKPIDHIKIIACIPMRTDIRIADTINQIIIKDDVTYSKYYIWALLNSKLIGWYAYRFIFGKAIRTMHFDNVVTCRIPIINPSIKILDAINDLSKQILNDTHSVNHVIENKIDEIIFQLYELNEEEIALINKST